MKVIPTPILDMPKASQATAAPRMRGVSKLALDLLSAAAGISSVAAESFTRPLVEEDKWPTRARILLRASDTVSWIAGLSGTVPSGSLRAIRAVEAMTLQPGSGGADTPWSSASPANRSLHDYLTECVSDLAKLSEKDLAELTHQHTTQGWRLDICPMAPFFARIHWAWDKQDNVLFFRPASAFLTEEMPETIHTLGIARITMIPFRVLAAAATACVEADRRAAGSKSRNVKPTGLRVSALSVPEKEKVAGPDDHSDLSNVSQPEKCPSRPSIAGSRPTNEQTHEVANEQSTDSSISVQRLGSLRLVAPPLRKTTHRVFAPTGVAPPCPEMTPTSRSPTRRPSSSPTQLPRGAPRRRTPSSMGS